MRRTIGWLTLTSVALAWAAPCVAQADTADLIGLWYAKLRFGPDVRGTLILDREDGGWRASLAGRSAPVRVAGDSLTFELPGNGGKFLGRIRRAPDASVVGRWVYPNRTTGPLTFATCGPGCLRAQVSPVDEVTTFYLKVTRRADGAWDAFLRNPERNLGGQWIPVRSIRRDGEAIALLDRNGKVLATGRFNDDVMSIPLRGNTYDFERLADTAYTDFYPRGRPTVKYTYSPPRKRNDGWEVARLRDVGIAEDSLVTLVQWLIDLPIDSVNTPQTHALLVARHGKLVLEEYFHGEHIDAPHNTRSASKTHLTALIGAAMLAGVPINPETPVYATLRPGATNLDARKQRMRLEHLITMSAGFDCNDSGDRPGDEDAIANQDANPDWTGMMLDVGMVRDPGTAAVYCSLEPYLGGEVLARVSGRDVPAMFDELLAKPLDMQRYRLGLSPLGRAYFGGGHQFVARDFLKLPQVYLSGGMWHGRRILSRAWVDRSIEPRFKLGSRSYGYLWWIQEFPYRGRTIRAYMQLGNGSQNAIFFPDLDLAIATFGANYNSPSINYLLNTLIPRFILPAVDDRR